MLSFREFIVEMSKSYGPTLWPGGPESEEKIRVYTNPTKNEFTNLMGHSHGLARAFSDKTGHVHMWKADDAYHLQAMDAMGIEPNNVEHEFYASPKGVYWVHDGMVSKDNEKIVDHPHLKKLYGTVTRDESIGDGL